MSLISYSQFQKDFIILGKLGSGNCASVYKIAHKHSNELFALKVWNNQKFIEYGQVTSEIEIITKINDQAVPKIYHYYYKDDYDEKRPLKRLQLEVGLIMELCDRTLEEQVASIVKDKTKSYNQPKIWNFMREMIRLFAKMQKMGYSHRDIKSGNIMIKDQGNIRKYKVIDFGYSLKDTPYASQSITGTPEYCSPKIKRKFVEPKIHIPGGLNVKDDVYSLGKTILELLRAKNWPNQKLTPSFFYEKLNKFDPNISFLLSKMLEYEEQNRWDFIRVEEEIAKIQNLKASKNIVIDEDGQIQIDNDNNMGQIHWEVSQEGHNVQNSSISMKKIKNSRTIQTQTESIQIQTTSIFPKKMHGNPFYSAQTRYLDNGQHLTESIVTKIFLNKCSFEAEVHSMKAFDEFVLFGMRNHIGVIPLKQKNDAIYKLRPTWFEGKTRQAVFHQISVIGTKIIFVGSFEHFFFCQLDELKRQLNFLFENHEQMEKQRVINQCLRKSNGKFTDYREPRLYQGNIECLYNQTEASQRKISCMDVPNENFLGIKDAVIFGHYDGNISIFNEDLTIHKDDNKVIQMMAFHGNKILFATAGGWINLIVYQQKQYGESLESQIYKFNTGSEIIQFKLVDPVETKPQVSNPLENQALVQIYLKNGEKHYLDHQLLRISSITLKKKVNLNQVFQSPWKWSFKNPAQNLAIEFEAERQMSTNPLKNLKIENYLIADNGQIYTENDKILVVDFKMKNPIAVDVSRDLFAIADQQGNVQLLYTEYVLDNVLKTRVKLEKREISKMVQRVSHYFQKLRGKESTSSAQSQTEEHNVRERPTIPKTYSQLLKLQGLSIDQGNGRLQKLKMLRSFAE